MSITHDYTLKEQIVSEVANKMLLAARTAPKARGKDTLSAAVVDKEGRSQLAEHMRLMVEEGRGAPFFLRDADNLDVADGLLLLGSSIEPMGLEFCGLCGFANCSEKEKHPNHPCVFNTGDLGIALGSAVSVAMEHRLDNRIMFSIGMAVRELKLLGEGVKIIYAVPLSMSGKNPFVDRKPKK
ncbi:MAG: ferredoxin domain-containing protein [Sphaerochaetaceae bacterium]|jgi:uncharacterized ferredoxin-like protein|nr:DUF2148 domain-containing protein [Sphaerochaetaceae bacterium]HHU88895.1 ferredoxin [Spirochaetales bacterium]